MGSFVGVLDEKQLCVGICTSHGTIKWRGTGSIRTLRGREGMWGVA